MAGEAGWDQTGQALTSMLRSSHTCGGACCGFAGLLGMADLSIQSFMPFFLPRCCTSWSPGTSKQHVQIRIIKKKKVILKKRKKLISPRPRVTSRPPVTSRPLVTNSPAGTLDGPKEQEPGITLLGALPGFAPLGHVCTLDLPNIGAPLAGPA